MTDLGGQENRERGGGNKKNSVDRRFSEHHCGKDGSTPPKQHLHERHGSSSNVEGFEDFEEFVLDFDDYDLLESIHTQLGSPLEPIRKSQELVQIHFVALEFGFLWFSILTVWCLFHFAN